MATQGVRAGGRIGRVIAFIVGAIGLIASVFALRDYARQQSINEINAAPLIQSTKDLSITPATPIDEGVVVANRIVVASGEIRFPPNGVWIANEIVMEPDTVLRGEGIAIVAKSVRNGRIDASGVNSNAPGGAGTAGGRIFLAAKSLEGVRLVARGGNGANGAPGGRGADGRSGKCKGFGGYRMATVGQNGGRGGDGGPGGVGGLIVARLVEPNTLRAEVDQGKGGEAGPGGQGGRGGTGCTGLGGSQPTKANGLPGPSGEPGDHGEDGNIDPHEISYQVLIDTVKANLAHPHALVDELRKL